MAPLARNGNRKPAAWQDRKALRDFIKSCPKGFHIDHIIPINGANVCGLHVLENLQYIDASSNLWKKNRFHPMSLEYAVCPIVDYKSVADIGKKARLVRKSLSRQDHQNALTGSVGEWEEFAKIAYENGYMDKAGFDYITMTLQNIKAHNLIEGKNG